MTIRLGGFWTRLVLVGALVFGSTAAHADLDRIQILERGLVADGKAFGSTGPYERLRGKLTFTVEAAAADNQAIADIRLAPRDAQGRIHFTTDFELLRPLDPTRANGRLLYEPPTNGDIGLMHLFNDGALGNVITGNEQAGNGFLMEQGYALLWTGWSWDVPLDGERLRAELPVASDNGRAIYGMVSGEVTVLQPTVSAEHTAREAIGYEPARIDDPDARLTVRETATGVRNPIPRERWQFGRRVEGRLIYDPSYISLEGGFKPGLIYTVTYATHSPRVAGLGLAGIRDALLFFHYERADHYGTPNPLVETGGNLPIGVLAFGHGQSARLLMTMVLQGLSADARGRTAFDGVLVASAGAGKGGFNYRFGQPSRHMSPDVELDFPTDWFPFTTTTESDPVTGATGSVLDKVTALNAAPRMIIVNSATDYWTRAASLTHAMVDGSGDIAVDRRVRQYMIASAAHQLAPSFDRDQYAYCRNPLDYRPILRALLLHLDGWVTLKKEPPPSMIPTFTENTLGKLVNYNEAMPRIPGIRLPVRMLDPPRLDLGPDFTGAGIASYVPPKFGRAFLAYVPMPDADGLDKAGIRVPEVSVPLGTYTGWNLQNAATGAPERLARYDGGFMPFARNENERLASADPRLSIAERYPKRENYVEAYAAATLALAKQEFLIGADINGMVDRAGALYDKLMARDPAAEGCAF